MAQGNSLRESLFAVGAPLGCVLAATLLIGSRDGGAVYRDRFVPAPVSPAVAVVHVPATARAVVSPAARVSPRVAVVASPHAVAAGGTPTVTISPTRSVSHGVLDGTDSESSEFEGVGMSWDEASWRTWWEGRMARYRAYWEQRRLAREAPARARLMMARSAMLQSLTQGNGSLDPSAFAPSEDCGPFGCAASSAPAAGASTTRVQAERRGSEWVLRNGWGSLIVDLTNGLVRSRSVRDGIEQVVSFETGSDEASSEEPTVYEVVMNQGATSATVTLSWHTSRRTQRAVVTLADGLGQPEAVVERTLTGRDGRTLTELSNLSRSERTWRLDGRDLRVSPGDVVRVEARPQGRALQDARDLVGRGLELVQPSV
ncbi:MAG: hypothetical protein Q8Q09_23760 [Deltaproteobacteria bacterium]|nr:hypothetical protein [Deltaproteobacteria bacterium]